MTKPLSSKAEVEPANVIPITLDDFEGEDRKSMEKYIKELTQEALMRASTRTCQGVIIKPGPRPKLASNLVSNEEVTQSIQQQVASTIDSSMTVFKDRLDATFEDKFDEFLRFKVGPLLADYVGKNKASTIASQAPIDQTNSRTDGVVHTVGPTGPDGRSDRNFTVGPTGQTAGPTGYYPGGPTGTQAGLTAPLDVGQTGAIIPIQGIDPMTNASYLYHLRTFDPHVSTAATNPQVHPHVPNAYNDVARGCPSHTRQGQYDHITLQTQPIRPPNPPPNQHRPDNMEEIISGIFRDKFGIETRNCAKVYQKPYLDYYDNVPFPRNYRVPEFTKFSGEDGRTTWEHVDQFLAQCDEANSDEDVAPRRERLDGQQFLDVSQLMQRALAQESRVKDNKKIVRPYEKKPNVNVIYYPEASDSEDEGGHDMYFAEWSWTNKNKPFVCSNLMATPRKDRQSEVKYSFDVAKCDKIFDYLLQEKQIRLPKGHIIPSQEELKCRAYCKWHDSHSHSTNDCNVFRRQVQSAIDEGRLKFTNGSKMKLDHDPFPVNTINFNDKKVLIRPEQAESTKGKGVIIGEPRPKMIVPKKPEVGVWKENKSEASTSKAPRKTKVTLDMLLEKYEKQVRWRGPRRPIHERLSSPNNGRFYGKNRANEERREGKRIKVEARTSEVITIKVGSHDVPIPSGDKVGESSSKKSEAGTSSSQSAGLTRPSGRSDRSHTAGLTGPSGRSDRRPGNGPTNTSGRRRLQRLRAQEIREKKAEEQRDKRFNELRPPPVWRRKTIEKEEPVVVEKKEEQSVAKDESSPKEDMDINMPVSRMLVDGGAAVNLMPYSLFKKLGRGDDELKKTNMILNGFNGEPTEVKGFFSAELTVGNRTLPTAFFIVDVQEANLEWLQKRVQEYRSTKNDIGETIEDFDEVEKLGQGFTSADPLEEVDIGDGTKPRPTFVNKNMRADYKVKIIELLKEYVDCFAWEYHEMPGVSRELVEHRLPIKPGFRPYKQPPRCFNPLLYDRVKEEIDQLLKAGFTRPCRYAEWVSSIIPVEKKGSADMMINDASGHKEISFLDDNAGYNQIFMAEEDMYKTAFRCPGFVGLFEWVVMTFGLKNAGATYQRAMNLIFHDLLGIILEIYIDDIVVKSDGMEGHIADLMLAFERMRRYGLKMNPLKCAFSVSAGKFLGFMVHERGVEIDPKKIEKIRDFKAPTCKKEVQKLLGKVNYLRRFISNLVGKIDAFVAILRLKKEDDFTWGAKQQEAFEELKRYLSTPPIVRAPKAGKPFWLSIASEDKVIGAVLTQEEDGKEYLITYLSRRLLDAEMRHIARHDNSRANDLAQQASGYNVKKGLFLILKEPVLDFRSLCEIGKIGDQGPSDRHCTTGLTGDQGWSDRPHAVGLTGDPERSDRPCMAGLTSSGQSARGHVSINLETELIVNSDICAQETEEDWRIPLVRYLKDPTLKVDRKIRRQAFKYTLLDEDLYRQNIDGVLLKCLDEDQSKVAMGEGHRFVLVATDYFTKWAEAVPLKNMTHTEANGHAESSNKTLLKLVKKKIEEHPKRWHEVLSEALWAHRISKHGVTKVTPFELVYGQEAVLPVEVNLGSLRYIKQDDLSSEDYKTLMGDNLDEVIDKRLKALEEIEKEKKRVAKAYNKRVKAKLFQVGDLVWKTILPLGTRSKEFGIELRKIRENFREYN
uniref:Putative gag-pol n=1 Tax=Oryza sativa subsp. japonica TaxID=39947 RepID=Q6UUI3_ORYSJ|nr:putative gag-pol precursor [Oryza sativa Japonica Group]